MRILLKDCKVAGIKFLNLKYRIPECTSNKGQESTGYQQVNWIGYSDDLIFTFESKNDLQHALALLDETFTRFSLAINVSKKNDDT